MSLLPRTNNSAGNEIYFALKSEIPAAQTLSQNGNTISLSGGGGSVNVASATAVALSTQKLTAVTYATGLLATNVDGLLTVGNGSIIGSTEIEGGRIAVSRGDALPSIELVDENTATVGTISYTGAAFTFNPPLTDSDFQTLSLIGNDLTISGGNTVDLSGMPVITALQDKTQNISAVAGVTDVSGNVVVSGDVLIKGANGSVDFFNSSNVRKAGLDYAEVNDKISLTGTNIVAETGSFARVIMDAASGIEVRTDVQDIKLNRYDATGATSETLLRLDASGQTSITSSGDTAKLQLTAAGGTTGFIGVDDNEPGLLITSPAPNNVVIQSGMSSYVKTTNAGGNVLLQVEGNSEAVLGYGSFTVSAQAADQGVIRVQAQGGKGGEITADEAMGNFVFAGKNGLGTAIENATYVGISATDLTSDIGMTVGSGEGQINMNADGAGNGTIRLITNYPSGVSEIKMALDALSNQEITMTTDGGAHQLRQTATATEIIGDSSVYGPTLRFVDPSMTVPTVDMTVRNDGYGIGTSEIATTAGFFSVSSGAVEGVAIGTNTSENLVLGNGLPLKISNSYATLPLQYIELQNGGLINITSVNPAIPDQTLTATFDPANYIQLTINDNATATGATIDMFVGGEMALSATGVLNQTADSANMSITNDLVLSALQTVVAGGGVRFNQSRMNANPILSTDYAITYTQVGAFTRTLPAVSPANIGQKYIITNSGTGVLTLAANGTQLIYSNGTGTNTKVITSSNTYTLTAIQSTTAPLYGWSMVGGGTTPLVWGSFSSTATQTATLANTTYFATYTTSDVTAQNCSFVGSEITITQACSKIRIQSSIIVSTVSPTTVFRFWLVKNGVNEPNTASIISIKDSGENDLEVCEWYDSCAVGDKYKVAFQSDTAGSTLTATVAGGVAPNDYPASPSIITTIQAFQ